MISTYSLPLLATIAFSAWGFILIAAQGIFFKKVSEMRRLFYSAIYLGFLIVTNIILLVLQFQMTAQSLHWSVIVSHTIVGVTIISLFLFNHFFIKTRVWLISLRAVLYLAGLIVFFTVNNQIKLFSRTEFICLYFAGFLALEIGFVLLFRQKEKTSRFETGFLIVLFLLIIAANGMDFVFKKYNFNHGIGIVGFFLPFYFMMKYTELQQKIEESSILINEILEKERKSYTASIYLIVNMLESKNNFIRGHSERVGLLAEIIGVKLGLSASDLEDLQNACLLHDIGYIGISFEAIMNKNIYTVGEFELIKRHPIVGAEILSKSSFFSKYADIILYHHENWNGTGYPFGLKGEKIPLFSRIIQIADNFDILTTNKFYRSALSKEDALLILRSGKGEEFDPKLVDIFISTLRL